MQVGSQFKLLRFFKFTAQTKKQTNYSLGV